MIRKFYWVLALYCTKIYNEPNDSVSYGEPVLIQFVTDQHPFKACKQNHYESGGSERTDFTELLNYKEISLEEYQIFTEVNGEGETIEFQSSTNFYGYLKHLISTSNQ